MRKKTGCEERHPGLSNEKDSFDRGVYYDTKRPRENLREMADNIDCDVSIIGSQPMARLMQPISK